MQWSRKDVDVAGETAKYCCMNGVTIISEWIKVLIFIAMVALDCPSLKISTPSLCSASLFPTDPGKCGNPWRNPH